jgi:uncharacterized protein (DUF1499 family)
MSAYRMSPRITISAALTLAVLCGCTTIVSPDYGVREGRFAPCPANQDCVSSQEQDPKLYIAPLQYSTTRVIAHDQLIAAISAAVTAAGAARIVSNHPSYIRVEYPAAGQEQRKSAYYYQPTRAVDEVEFYFAPNTELIEMRSVGKLGLLESGGTRERLERIRAAFDALQKAGKP